MAGQTKVRYGAGRPNGTQRAIAGMLVNVAQEFSNFLQLNNRIATGRAINSFEVDVKRFRDVVNEVQGEALLSAVPYIAFALQGREAGGMPPIDKIQRWIEVKGAKKENGEPLDAWAVAKTIEALGTNDPHMSDDEVDVIIDISWDKWGDRIVDGYAEQIADNIVSIFTKTGYEEKNG